MIGPEEREELIQLLPFYVNDTLDAADRKRIDTALVHSAELRDALKQETALKRRIVTGMDNITEQSPEHEAARGAMLNARASAATRPETVKSSALANALSMLSPKRWHPAIALSLALAVPALAGAVANQSNEIARLEAENFRLASGPCEDESAPGRLLIEVKDDARFDRVAELLASEELEIIRSGDFGTLTVKTKKAGADLTAQLERLRATAIIASAEPAA
jgi:hypothetical protein